MRLFDEEEYRKFKEDVQKAEIGIIVPPSGWLELYYKAKTAKALEQIARTGIDVFIQEV